jgi:preprotein translocase subunit SecE
MSCPCGRHRCIGIGDENPLTRGVSDAVRETKKVVWPTRKEAMQMTGYVFAFVFVMALFLWLTDKTLEWVLYDLILRWRS